MTDTTKPALPEPDICNLGDLENANWRGYTEDVLSAAIDAAVAEARAEMQERIDDQLRTIKALMVGMPDEGTTPVIRRIAWLEQQLAEARAVPDGWADQVEQRLLTWKQRRMNRSGDRLALNDFMGQDSIDDLIDFVCAPLDCGEAGHDEGRCGNASCCATPSPAEQPKPAMCPCCGYVDGDEIMGGDAALSGEQP